MTAKLLFLVFDWRASTLSKSLRIVENSFELVWILCSKPRQPQFSGFTFDFVVIHGVVPGVNDLQSRNRRRSFLVFRVGCFVSSASGRNTNSHHMRMRRDCPRRRSTYRFFDHTACYCPQHEAASERLSAPITAFRAIAASDPPKPRVDGSANGSILCISAISPLRTDYECWWPAEQLIA
jgi:hypothetical protein